MYKTKLVQQAEQNAKIYVWRQNNLTKEEEFTAIEDYMAGYMTIADKLEFALSQLEMINQFAKSNQEVYAQTIASYTINKLK